MANLRNIYDSRRIWKVVFLAISLVLVALFLYISNNLVKDLAEQERERMEIWADATRELATMGSGNDIDSEGNPIGTTDVGFLLHIIEANHNIPVLLVDDQDNILLHRNFRLPEPEDSLAFEIPPTSSDWALMSSTIAVTALSIPRLRSMGLAPAVTFFKPVLTIA